VGIILPHKNHNNVSSVEVYKKQLYLALQSYEFLHKKTTIASSVEVYKKQFYRAMNFCAGKPQLPDGWKCIRSSSTLACKSFVLPVGRYISKFLEG